MRQYTLPRVGEIRGDKGSARRGGKETPEERGETKEEEVRRYWCKTGGVKEEEVEQDGRIGGHPR